MGSILPMNICQNQNVAIVVVAWTVIIKNQMEGPSTVVDSTLNAGMVLGSCSTSPMIMSYEVS